MRRLAQDRNQSDRGNDEGQRREVEPEDVYVARDPDDHAATRPVTQGAATDPTGEPEVGHRDQPFQTRQRTGVAPVDGWLLVRPDEHEAVDRDGHGGTSADGPPRRAGPSPASAQENQIPRAGP